MFDTMCVGIAGRNAINADAVWHLACAWGGPGACSVLGRPGAATSAPYAAFINAFQIHAQEFDCVHEGAVAHPMARWSRRCWPKSSERGLMTALLSLPRWSPALTSSPLWALQRPRLCDFFSAILDGDMRSRGGIDPLEAA